MRRFGAWLGGILADALARTIAGVLAGVLITIAYGAIAYRLSSFLLQQVTTPVLVILVLSLFAAVGVIVPSLKLWELLSRNRKQSRLGAPRDDRLEEAARMLRGCLAQVEAGMIYVMREREFTAEVLAAFDDWEVALQGYLSLADREAVRTLRAEIAGRSLPNSRQEASDWLSRVKALTNIATQTSSS